MKIENFIAHIVPPHVPLCREMNDNVASSYSKARMDGVTCLNKQNGFTLIEIIITLVIAAILAAMISTYFGSSITQSGMPIVRLGKALQLQTVMENITADYKSLYNGSTYTYNLIALQSNIGVAGTSQNNNYGQYTVIYNGFISFDPTTHAEGSTVYIAGSYNLLKVTVKSATGESLMLLYPQS